MTAASAIQARRRLTVASAIVVIVACVLAVALFAIDLQLDARSVESERHLRANEALGSVLAEQNALLLHFESIGDGGDEREDVVIAEFAPSSSLQLIGLLLDEHEALHEKIGGQLENLDTIEHRFDALEDAVRSGAPLSDDLADRATWRLLNFDLASSLTQARQGHAAIFEIESDRIAATRSWVRAILVAVLIVGGTVAGVALTVLRRARRRAERNEEIVRRTLSSVMDSIPEPLVFVDPDGSIALHNKVFRRVFTTDDPTGHDIGLYMPQSFVIHGDERPGTRRVLTSLRRSDGSEFPVEIATARVMWEETGLPIGTVAIAKDLTHEREQQRDLQQAVADARAASEAKTRFVANTSHELRTPLTAIIGFAEILEESEPDPEHSDHVRQIRDNADHLLRLIDDVLDISRIESGEVSAMYEEVDASSLVQQITDDLRPMIGDRPVELETVLPRYAQPIVTDRVKLRQILMNLVSNAIKFTERGEITVTVSVDEGGRPERIEVADTGIGIAPEMIDVIRRPFRQADDRRTRRFGGTGLGLPISIGLAEFLGHRLEITSTLNAGSTFSLLLGADRPGEWDARLAESSGHQPDPSEGLMRSTEAPIAGEPEKAGTDPRS